MKNLTSPIQVNVTYRQLADSLFQFAVNPSLQLNPHDSITLATAIVEAEMSYSPELCADTFVGIDRSSVYVYVPTTPTLLELIPTESVVLDPIYLTVELSDGQLHKVKISLCQNLDCRSDYLYIDRRILFLRGTIELLDVSNETECGDEELS